MPSQMQRTMPPVAQMIIQMMKLKAYEIRMYF